MKRFTGWALSGVMLLGAAGPLAAHADWRDRNGNWNRGFRDSRPYNDRYDGNYRRHQGGIGPGKGALIGGAGGAILGAAFGGGMKGAVIGGAIGAGGGALLGKAHQNNVRRQDYRDRRWDDGNRWR